MRYLLVHTLDAASPEDAAKAVAAIDPPSIPGFAGETRIVIEPFVSHVIDYLDGGDMDVQDALSGIAPVSAPLGLPVTRDGVREVWDAYIVPTQQDEFAPQSVETRQLMAILRAVYVALPATTKEPAP